MISEDIIIKTPNGNLEGDFYLGNDKCIILCHGQFSNKDRKKNKLTIEKLSREGFSVLGFNYGASGKSYKTNIDINKQIKDLKSVVGFIEKRGYKEIGLIGDSLSGLIISKAYPDIQDNIKKICFWAPVLNSRLMNILKSHYPDLDEQIEKQGYYTRIKDNIEFRFTTDHLDYLSKINQKELIEKIEVPVLIIHGGCDNVVKLEDSEKACEILKNARLMVIKGAPHNFKDYENQLSDLAIEWFSEEW